MTEMDTYRRRLMYTFLVVGVVILVSVFAKSRKVKVNRQIPIKQIDDWGVRTLIDRVLYEFSGPEKGMNPTVQIIFFHGLLEESGDFMNAFLDTWKTSDDSQLWPKELLSDIFKNARILSVSYDSNVKRSSTGGNLDLYRIAENSLHDLTDGEDAIASQGNCPVVLVGKDVGCLVIQAICCRAAELKEKKTFLQNIRGFVFYCPVLMGLKECPSDMDGELAKCLHWGNEEISRLNQKFLQTKGEQRWRLKVMMAANRVDKKGESITYIQEASSRICADVFYSTREDWHSICRPRNRTSKSFIYLTDLIRECLAWKSQGQKVQGIPENPVGLEDCARKVEQKLTGAFVLGIVGMGGSGKTALAKQLFNNISSEFDCTCFITDAKQITPISSIESHVKSAFYEKGNRIMSIEWSVLEKKKVLIALDDVDCDDHVKFLPTLNLVGEGSKIVLTTRNRDVVKCRTKSIYHDMDLLDQEKAERLFCVHAFNLDRIPESLSMDMTDYAKKIINKCDGLPLTLEVVGRYLGDCEGNLDLWEQTFIALSEADGISDINEKVWKKLRVSYDALEIKEQQMFIDVATFFAKEDLETALSTWKTMDKYHIAKWTKLVSRCLVKCHEVSNHHTGGIFPYTDIYTCIWMHEHLQDLGKKMSSTRGENLSQTNSNQTTSPRQLSLSYFADDRFDVTGKDFTNLKYLNLSEVSIEGTSENFPKNLHFLRWSTMTPASFPVDLMEMNNLTVLELDGFKQVQPSKFPPALRILKLCDIEGFKGFSEEFATLSPDLEVVEITECPDLETLPDSFGNLKGLQRLHLGNPLGVRGIYLDFKKQQLSLSNGDSAMLCRLPKTFGQLTALRVLFINAPELGSLPDSFEALKSLQRLMLRSCKIQGLPKGFGKLTSLKELFMKVPHLLSLPGSFSMLSALTRLEITSNKLESLPDSFGELSSLQDLTLETSNLISLSGDFGRLSALSTLMINSAELESLPENFGQLSSLHDLTLKTSNLISLSGDFGRLSALSTLMINSAELESLPETFGELSSLHHLTLETSNLISLSGDFGRLSALSTLMINSAELESLPETFGELSSLHHLTLETSNLISLQGDFGRLSALRTLKMDSWKLERLSDAIGELSSLQNLTISRCPNLQCLPEGVGGLSSLQGKLTLRSCPKLLQLPKSLGCRDGDTRAEVEGDNTSGSAGGHRLVVEVEDCFYLADNMLRGLQSVKVNIFPFHFWDVNPIPSYKVVMTYPDRASNEPKRAKVFVEYVGEYCSFEIAEDPASEGRPRDPSSSDAGLHISHTGGAVPSAIESARDKMIRLFREADVHPTELARRFSKWMLADVENKEFESALKLINARNELDKDDGWLWQERGVLRRLMGDLSGALEDLNNALETEPDDYEMLKHRAYVKHLLSDDTGASADAERAIQVRPARVDRESYGKDCLGVLPVQFLHYRLK